MNQLELYVPNINDLWFKSQMMSDPLTMNYNKNFKMFEGYNPLDGTIEFPKNIWQTWFDKWINKQIDFMLILLGHVTKFGLAMLLIIIKKALTCQ